VRSATTQSTVLAYYNVVSQEELGPAQQRSSAERFEAGLRARGPDCQGAEEVRVSAEMLKLLQPNVSVTNDVLSCLRYRSALA